VNIFLLVQYVEYTVARISYGDLYSKANNLKKVPGGWLRFESPKKTKGLIEIFIPGSSDETKVRFKEERNLLINIANLFRV
jgi:hypothetical protein